MNTGNAPLPSEYKEKKREDIMQDFRLKFLEGKQKELLEKVIQKEFDSQSAFAKFIGVKGTTVRDWLKEKNNIPKSTFDKITVVRPQYNHFSSFIEMELPWNWGRIKGGKSRIAKIDDLASYLERARSFIIFKRRQKPTEKLNIENCLLNQLITENVDLLSILAICIQTDGSLIKHGREYRISFSSSDEILINFVKAILVKLSEFNPCIYRGNKSGKNVAVSDLELGKKLLELSPEYRTFAMDKNRQPTINFLYEKNQQTKIWAIRFAFTTDGCITLPKNGKAEINLSCYNKCLSEEWVTFLKQFEIKGHVAKLKKAKEGVRGVRIYDSKSIYNFYELGGFVNGVKISRKSKKHVGLEKNALLKRVVEKILQEGGFEPPTFRSPIKK